MMSAPAVKPALPTSGAQPPRVGAGGPPSASNANPPPSATAGQKLPTNQSSSPVKPTGPANANHAMSSAVPLSLVQDHKTQSNALAQPPMSIPRTPEKTKDHLPPAGPKPTSNGVEGSPNKAPVAVSLPSPDNKKPEEPSQVTAVLNHSTDNSLAISTVNATATPITAGIGGTGIVASVPQPQQVSSVASSHPTATQPSPAKQETPPAAAVAAASAAPVAVPSAITPPAAAKSAIPNSSPTANKPEVSAKAAVAAAPPAVDARPAPAPAPDSAPTPPPPPAAAPASTPPAPAVPAVAPVPVIADVKAPPAASAVPAEPPAPKQAPASTPPSAGAPASGPGPGLAPAQESPAKPAPPAPPEVTKTRIEVSKPEFKVATPRVSKRKRETKPVIQVKVAVDPNDDRKSKRVRTRTQPYQSPLPEIPYMAKIKNLMKTPDDKLIVFYKNEFLAVRNAEGSFYVCQAMQNIYKSSTRIRIRWLSQEKKENKTTDVYIPDFYDITEFDCILTNLELKKLDKNKYKLPQDERDRTQSILKRALDVEKGVAEKPPITEEHPDGLDLSLYRNEDQLKKKRSSKRSGKKSGKSGNKEKTEVEAETDEESHEDEAGESEEEVKKKKQKSKSSKKEKPKSSSKEKTKGREREAPKKERTSERERGREREREREREATKRKADTPSTAKNTVAKPPPEKKAKVATSKPARKSDKPEGSPEPAIPTRSSKSRSAKSAAPQPSKSSPTTRTKERERRSTTAAQARKKPGKKA